MSNVLLFPDGGWLVENRYFEDTARISQMNALRKSCIPKVKNWRNLLLIIVYAMLQKSSNLPILFADSNFTTYNFTQYETI